ncbi:related to voltage-gated shaker-like K+ channel, subunit beta/KCNAB [Ramularia collo-cygni]|uniref:Related to voltage-gated shaker-like K+ channel, subunit beta/KCNAB n=1 Tax=Ramularia collo-cygni TaxID=112498 RepID=A0A2D3V2K4_9PEZI|nr:related to voltage-gated shaker-like K+ channel, subunit beta/KCNAB [Ramularia collo-cygni]CZT24507.1 related to voltage-gated shaker-like K+ channel, subunit beta/KCNAB [Ramularia collo-cygni]
MASLLNKAKDALHLPTNKNKEISIAGQKIHHTGYGLMGLTWRANPPTQEQAFEAMKTALDNGANFWNGGELYGNEQRNSLHLLNEYFTKYPQDASKVVISIKGGLIKGGMKPDGSPDNIRRSIEECLRVLDGKKSLDIFEAARVDPNTPIEITMRTANEYIKSGKLGGISLSECSADTIRRAAKEVEISAVEVEFSLWERTILENGVAQACAELDIPIVAYSPLGRGFLTGQIKSISDIPEDDMRRHYPQFQPENFEHNIKMVHELEAIANRKGCTPGQIGLAWVRSQSGRNGLPIFIPIPGATTAERVRENLVEVELSENDLKEIDSLLASHKIVGDRYPEHVAALSFGNSPPLKE